MTWSRRFRLKQSLRESLWVVPVGGGLVGAAIGIAAADAPTIVDLPSGLHYSEGTARAVLASVVGASIGLTGFVVTVTVLVIQMATGTFSARYMRLFYRSVLLKAVLAVLLGTFTLSYVLLRRIEPDDVPSFGVVTLAGLLLGLGVGLFVFFLNSFVHRLRPVAVAALVAGAGRRAFEDSAVAPAPYDTPGELALVSSHRPSGCHPGRRHSRARLLGARARLRPGAPTSGR